MAMDLKENKVSKSMYRENLEILPKLVKALETGNWEGMEVQPKAGCDKCYGRGWPGREKTGQFIVCGCVKKRTPRNLAGRVYATASTPEGIHEGK